MMMNRIINSINLEPLLPQALVKRMSRDVKKSLKRANPPRLALKKELAGSGAHDGKSDPVRWLT
jgi:hypothetical protein